MLAAELGDDPPARRALEEAELEQVRLVDVLDRVGLLAERDGERREADRAAAELLGDRRQQLAVDALEPAAVDLEQLERLAGDVVRDLAGVAHLGDVAHAPQDPVRDPRRAARAARDLVGGVVLDLDVEDARRAAHDRAELRRARSTRAGTSSRSGRAAASSAGPDRVVAPTSVNGGRSIVSVRAAAPWPKTMSSRKSSSAG